MTVQDRFSAERLDGLFPRERADAFFEALFGGAEEGAYDIRLTAAQDAAGATPSGESREDELRFYFELRQRPGHCLVCSLTYGLPRVFERHPVIDIKGLVAELARLAEWNADDVWWRVGSTESVSESLHRIPLVILRHKDR